MFTFEDLRIIGDGYLPDDQYDRALAALNGLAGIFGKKWIEDEIVIQRFDDHVIIAAMGSDKLYGGVHDIQKMISVWEDIQELDNLPGFQDLLKKLNKKLDFDNVDLELSVIADLSRCGAEIQLEPMNGNGQSKADCQFRLARGLPWIYVEITRKMQATAEKLIDTRGEELAELVSKINPERRCVIALKENVNDEQYAKIVSWLKTCPAEGEFENLALFFSVPHGVNDTIRALEYAPPPRSVRQFGGAFGSNAFGIAYLHIPNLGAKDKLVQKIPQLPSNEIGILVIDLTRVANGVNDWTNQICFDETNSHCSAIIFIQDFLSSNGPIRRTTILQNPAPKIPLDQNLLEFLSKFKDMRTTY
ncbi:hypothetical protein RF679_15925 [Undibacterium cyanobacteriorum]|uniref:Uncharacterized protein n=1 Tax=Undibacterium cyanobacteriorum TaxID=3073561 RepID=A0ABY9RFX5_9BURK|nr:hypothetical protein [Undibacterium sp. 20NA77.5]WMW80120.1 hypothetical protein RF679_15925 [Undibacterium sp. 20NA77.5]